MEFGVHLPLLAFRRHAFSLAHLVDYAQTAEQFGFSTLCANDHLIASRPWLDSVTALAAILTDVVRKYDVLRLHCEARGRPYESVLRIYLTLPLVLAETYSALKAKLSSAPQSWLTRFQSSTFAGTLDEAIAQYRALANAGVQYFIVSMFRHDIETLQFLAQQIVPAVSTS